MTNNKQQTAVQILIDSLIKLGYLHSIGFGQSIKVTKVINQAKEMEKAQIKDAYNDGHTDGVNQKPGLTSGTIYYNETYGGGNK